MQLHPALLLLVSTNFISSTSAAPGKKCPAKAKPTPTPTGLPSYTPAPQSSPPASSSVKLIDLPPPEPTQTPTPTSAPDTKSGGGGGGDRIYQPVGANDGGSGPPPTASTVPTPTGGSKDKTVWLNSDNAKNRDPAQPQVSSWPAILGPSINDPNWGGDVASVIKDDGGSLATWGEPVPGDPPKAVRGMDPPRPWNSNGTNPRITPLYPLMPGSGWASTTTYSDGGKNGCGCLITEKDFGLKLSDGRTLYQAAGSSALFGEDTWLGRGCGTCYNLVSAGIGGHHSVGSRRGSEVLVMVSNLCPNGDNSWCPPAGQKNMVGFYVHFDMSTKTRVFNGDPWDNPIVHYQAVVCPKEALEIMKQCGHVD